MKILIPQETRKELTLTDELKQKIQKHRQEIKDILESKDNRTLLIIGPCSAYPPNDTIEYAKQISLIQEQVKDKIKIILRVYTQKPRTTLGWEGLLIQPDPFNPPNIQKGIEQARKLMIEITKLNLPIADEILFTHSYPYLKSLLSYSAIGARSTEDQEHRNLASHLNHPVGLKNPTSGDIKKAINSVISTQNSHTFLLNNNQITSNGNPHSHLILRGGKNISHINQESINQASDLLQSKNIKNPSIIIDLSHDNSNKEPLKQIENLKKIQQLENKKYLKGFMIESFLKTGNQKITTKEQLKKGLSITDPCLGLEETKNLIKEFYEFL